MRVERFRDARAFANHATAMLMRDEPANHFFLGQLQQLESKPDAVMCAVEDGVDAVAVATMTPPWHMMITPASAEAAAALAEYLHESRVPLPGIQGDRGVANVFAGRWVELTGRTRRAGKETGLHRLERVIPPARPAAGTWRHAGSGDVELVAAWVRALRIDIGEAMPEDARDVAARRIAEREMVLWEDGGSPVSLAGASFPTPNGIRVVLVYTPPERRNRGYASSLVAARSQHLLDGGRKFCFLYTDLANPTSNKIYRAIGYEHVCDSVQIFFD